MLLRRWAAGQGRRLFRSEHAFVLTLLRVRASLDLRSFGPRWVLNVAVAAVVLSLPLAATASSAGQAQTGTAAVTVAGTIVSRAQTASRGGTISAVRAPITVDAEGTRPIQEYTLGKADTLVSLSNYYGVSPEAIAFANGITDPSNLEVGRSIRIPPGDGALYTVASGDSIASVAERFKVDPTVVMQRNRLYFEPEHFAPGQLIFVPGAALPGLVYAVVPVEVERPTVITRAGPASAPQPAFVPTAGDTLSYPVRGWRLTQGFRPGHTGLDLAAPYGSPIVAPADGIVSSAGWVAVGGVRVCVNHGNGLESCSHHMMPSWAVGTGQRVARGDLLGWVGLTGVTTGPHDHFEVKKNGVFVDPRVVLR